MHYIESQLSLLDRTKVPHHVAIMMDGNRRWEKRNRFQNIKNIVMGEGHAAGAKVLTTTVEAALELGIKILTVFGFSTENWLRPQKEVDFLLTLFEDYLRENRQKMVNLGVRFSTIGDLTPFPKSLKDEVEATVAATQSQTKIDFVIAMNYGGRDDLKRAFKKMLTAANATCNFEIDEKMIASCLDTARYPDPDLLIRTSGEMRVSNFLLWQTAYSEFYVTDVLWPDFSPEELLKAVASYQTRNRRLGR